MKKKKWLKKAIREVMGNSGEGKQFKPFDLSGNPTWKLFLEKNKCFSEFCSSTRGILVILVMLQVWLEKNWKQWSVCFGCIFDMGLHWLKWEKKWASLKKISTLIFGKMFDFFVPRRSWQFPVKSDAKASISFARPWNSP